MGSSTSLCTSPDEYNNDFIPFNNVITTDDVQQPSAYMFLMAVVVMVLTALMFSWGPRSVSNLFTSEYRTEYSPDEKMESFYENHPMHHVLMWWGYGAGSMVAFCLVVAWIVWTWVRYMWFSCNQLSVPKDLVAFVSITLCGMWVAFMHMSAFWDTKAKRDILKSAVNGDPVARRQIKELTALQPGAHFAGMHGTTNKNTRMVIYWLNMLVFGSLPVINAFIGIFWDRTVLPAPDGLFVPNQVLGLAGTTGILLGLVWVIHSIRNMHAFDYYDDKLLGTKEGARISYSDMHKAQVGLACDVVGPSVFLKGAIPYQFCPWHIAIAYAANTYASGFMIYNDRLQATCLFIVCGLVPLLLTFIAQNNIFYITYYITGTFIFYTSAYWLLAVAFPPSATQPDQQSINFGLMALNQSETFPIGEPYNDYGTSILLVCVIALLLAVYSFMRVLTSTDIVDMAVVAEEAAAEEFDRKGSSASTQTADLRVKSVAPARDDIRKRAYTSRTEYGE